MIILPPNFVLVGAEEVMAVPPDPKVGNTVETAAEAEAFVDGGLCLKKLFEESRVGGDFAIACATLAAGAAVLCNRKKPGKRRNIQWSGQHDKHFYRQSTSLLKNEPRTEGTTKALTTHPKENSVLLSSGESALTVLLTSRVAPDAAAAVCSAVCANGKKGVAGVAFGEVDAGDMALGVGGPSKETRVGKVNPDEKAFDASATGKLAGNDAKPAPDGFARLDVAAPNTGDVAALIKVGIGNLGVVIGGGVDTFFLTRRPSSSDPDSYKTKRKQLVISLGS